MELDRRGAELLFPAALAPWMVVLIGISLAVLEQFLADTVVAWLPAGLSEMPKVADDGDPMYSPRRCSPSTTSTYRAVPSDLPRLPADRVGQLAPAEHVYPPGRPSDGQHPVRAHDAGGLPRRAGVAELRATALIGTYPAGDVAHVRADIGDHLLQWWQEGPWS